jgi:hypothetical protein
MIRRRRVVITLALLGLVLLGACFALWPFSPRPQINHDDYLGVEMGMTEAQVETVLGGPAGDYRVGDVLYTVGGDDEIRQGRPIVRSSDWRGNEGLVMVGYDADGQVAGKTYIPVGTRSLHPAAVLRHLFRR